MATYHAITATSQAIVGMLIDACPKTDEFDGITFELYGGPQLADSPKEGVAVYLYRVAINTSRRNLPPTLRPDGQRYRPPLPLDLHYLVVAFARTAAKQQRWLGWALRTLEDTPVLPANVLNHYGPEANTFRGHEAVELVAESLSLQDMANIWEVAKPQQQPSLGYVARMIAIESDVPITEAPSVQTRIFELAKGPPA